MPLKKSKEEKMEKKKQTKKAEEKTKEIKTTKTKSVAKTPSKVSKKTQSKATKKFAPETKANKKVTAKKVEAKSTQTAKNVKKSGEKAQKTSKKPQKSEKTIKNPKILTIDGYKNLKLYTMVFDDVKNPKAVVVIVHGMQEHCSRYENFAKFLNSKGYIVVATDLRGHGHTMKNKDDYGKGDEDIFQETLQDQLKVIDFANKFNLPVYLFGHSYGSMLSQNLIQMSPIIKKAVLCGTTNGDCLQFKMGSCLISLMSPFKDHDKRGGLAEKLCIKSYQKGFRRGNWFSRDEAVFDDYIQDEFCGGSFPFSFYRSLIKNMRKTNKGINKIKDKQILLIAGSKDPVGQNSKQVKKLLKIYLKNNIDAKIKIYENARHELLNETNKEEVFSDILKFFEE